MRYTAYILFLILILILLFFWSCKVNSQSSAVKLDTTNSAVNLDTLPYFLYFPDKNIQLYPLVIFLHGYGQDVSTPFSPGLQHLVSPKVQNTYPCLVFAPQCPKGEKWVDTDWRLMGHTLPKEPNRWMKKLMQTLTYILEKYPIDRKKIYLTGLSMGGFGTWDLAMRQPETFAALVPVCGGGDTMQAPKIAHIPTWVFHGAQDNVISVERSRAMVRCLQKAGANPYYTEFPSLKHNSWDSAYAKPELYSWLFSQSKQSR
jgi:predicted peptidase